MNIFHPNRYLSPFQSIILGFAAVIMLGGFMLCLPAASANGESAPLIDAMFTSTSAVCVTGLVVRDTATSWSPLGQAIILLLIQIGGLGVVTVAGAFTVLSGRKINLLQRSTMQEAIAAKGVDTSHLHVKPGKTAVSQVEHQDHPPHRAFGRNNTGALPLL